MEFKDAYPGLLAGETKEVFFSGHIFLITATTQVGVHTWKRKYKVQCKSCGVLIHIATTSPQNGMQHHVK